MFIPVNDPNSNVLCYLRRLTFHLKQNMKRYFSFQSNLDITARLGVGGSGRYTELAVISKFSSNDNFSNWNRISYTVRTCDTSKWA